MKVNRRRQAIPLHEHLDWQITRADLLGFAALLLVGAVAFGIWKAFS